jgi:hypothetical protein
MEVEILVKKFKSTFALTAILMVTVLLSGCFGGTKTFTLTVNVDPEGAAEVKDLAKKYDKDTIAEFALEAAEGYEFVEWTGDDKPVYNDEDEVWEIVMDGDKTLTAVFKEIEEEPVDPEPVADEEAAAAVDAQIMALDKEVGLDQYKIDVAAARAAYEALNAETKALVTKLVLLEVHEDQLDELLYGEVTEFVIAEKVMDGIDLTADVLEDITLGSNFTYDGTVYQVTWESDKPEIITADGTVNRPYGEDVEVTLTATLDFIGTLSADQKNVFEIKLNVVGIRFDLAVENGSVTATLNDLTGLDAVTADDFAITFAIADEAVEAEDLKVEYKDGVATWTFTPFERGLEDYKVDIAVTFGEFEEKDSLEFVGLAVIVETVDAIDTGKVEVTITASDVDRFAQTVEVLDNKGNEVKVKAVDIPAGETKLVFVFEDTIEKQEGVWTIGGVEYDFDLVSNLAAFRATTSQLELNKVLTDLGIEGVVAANMPEYVSRKATFLTKLDTDKKELTVEAIQTWIEEVNAAIIKEGEKGTAEKAAVDAVQNAIKAENDLALLAALQNPLFERVNADWFDDYKTKLTNDDETVTAIQEKINGVNDGKIEALTIENNVDTDDLLKSKALIIKYATPTEKGEQTQDTKDALEEIEIQLAVADVLTATTPTTLKVKLTALDNVLAKDDKFMATLYKDANAAEYFYGFGEEVDGFENATIVNVENVEDVKGILKGINEAIVAKAKIDVLDELGKVNNETAAADVVALLAESQKLHEKENEVIPANAEAYKVAVIEVITETGEAFTGFTGDSVDDLVATVNKAQASLALLVAVNSAATAEDMSAALVALEADQDPAETTFTDLETAAKLEVAQIVIGQRDAIEENKDAGQKAKEFAKAEDAFGAVAEAITARETFIDAVNGQATISGMKDTLAAEDTLIPEFAKLDTVEQTDAAEAVLNALEALKAKDPAEEFETIAQIKAAAGLL